MYVLKDFLSSSIAKSRTLNLRFMADIIRLLSGFVTHLGFDSSNLFIPPLNSAISCLLLPGILEVRHYFQDIPDLFSPARDSQRLDTPPSRSLLCRLRTFLRMLPSIHRQTGKAIQFHTDPVHTHSANPSSYIHRIGVEKWYCPDPVFNST